MIGSAWPRIFMGRPEEAADRARRAMTALRAEPELAAAETIALNLGAPLAVWPGALDELSQHLVWLNDRFGGTSALVRIVAKLETTTMAVLDGRDPPSPTFSPAEREIIGDFPFWTISNDMLRLFPALVSGDHRSVESIARASLEQPGAPGQIALLFSSYVAASARTRGHRDVIEELRQRLDDWTDGPPGFTAIRAARGIIQAELAWLDGDLDGAAAVLIDTDAAWSATYFAVQLDPMCELALLREEQGRRKEALELLSARLDDLVGRLGAPGRVALCGPSLEPLLSELATSNPHSRRVLEILQRTSPPNATPIPGTAEVLTPRELEVLEVLATGALNADIAAQLYLSINTVKTHVQRILTKLQAGTRTEAVARARGHRLV